MTESHRGVSVRGKLHSKAEQSDPAWGPARSGGYLAMREFWLPNDDVCSVAGEVLEWMRTMRTNADSVEWAALDLTVMGIERPVQLKLGRDFWTSAYSAGASVVATRYAQAETDAVSAEYTFACAVGPGQLAGASSQAEASDTLAALYRETGPNPASVRIQVRSASITGSDGVVVSRETASRIAESGAEIVIELVDASR